MKSRIYLDYNATSPLRPAVREAMLDIMERPVNASSVHAEGREGRKVIEQARAQVAALVGAPTNQVIFNSGATEANNTVLQYFAKDVVLVSAVEHDSVRDVLPNAIFIPVLKNGLVDMVVLGDLLRAHKPALVSVMLANNETGVVQDVAEISRLAKSHGALLHCDSVQAAGRMPMDITALGVDFMSLSAHKMGGPQGVGALVLGLCGITPILLHGGGQEKKARAGTENVAGIVGFGVAASLAQEELQSYHAQQKLLQQKLEVGLQQISPAIVIYGADALRLPNTTLIGVPGFSSESLLMHCDLEGIAISNGAACSSGTVRPSHVLQAMGVVSEGMGTIRISTGYASRESDIDAFLVALAKIVARGR